MAEWQTSSEWPVPLPYAILHGRIQVPRNDSADGGVAPDLDRYMYDAVLTASIPQVHYIDTADPRLFVLAPIPVKINQAGQLYGLDGQPGISLVPTDGAGGKLNHTGWTWTLSPSEDADELTFEPLTFAAPSGSTIDIALVAGQPVSSGEGVEIARAMAAAAALAAERAIENAGSASADVEEARRLAGQVTTDRETVASLAGEAETSASEAAASAAAAKTSEANAAESAELASASEAAADASAKAAQGEMSGAQRAAALAAESEANAAASAAAAKTSESNAASSAAAAETSESNAAASAATIAQYADQIETAADIDQKIADAVAGKADADHTHTTAQVTGLDTALAGKADATHTHVSADITDAVSTSTASTANSDKLVKLNAAGRITVPPPSTRTEAVNRGYVDDAVGKKADTSHTHTIAQVTSLQTTLNGKAASADLGGLKFWSGTQSEYDAISSKDATTVYFIKES